VRDNDRAGHWAAERLAERAQEAGIEAMALAPTLGDFNDDLRQLGPGRIAYENYIDVRRGADRRYEYACEYSGSASYRRVSPGSDSEPRAASIKSAGTSARKREGMEARKRSSP